MSFCGLLPSQGQKGDELGMWKFFCGLLKYNWKLKIFFLGWGNEVLSQGVQNQVQLTFYLSTPSSIWAYVLASRINPQFLFLFSLHPIMVACSTYSITIGPLWLVCRKITFQTYALVSPTFCSDISIFLAAQSSSRSLVVGWSVGWSVRRLQLKPTYLPTYVIVKIWVTVVTVVTEVTFVTIVTVVTVVTKKIFSSKNFIHQTFSLTKKYFLFTTKKYFCSHKKKTFFFLTKYQNTVFTTKDFFSPKKNMKT